MVFLVRGTLTEEDKTAWKRLAARKKRDDTLVQRAFRVGYIIFWAGWLVFKFFGLYSFFYVATVLPRLTVKDTPLWLRIPGVFLVLVLFGCGICVLILFPHPPGWPEPLKYDALPAEPPDGFIRAVFFGDGRFVFWNASGKIRLGYSFITGVYEDAGRFYLFFRDRPPLVLPKRGFAGGTAEDFRDFLEAERELFINRIKEKNHLSY